MKGKSLLNESTIRRFMALANLGSVGHGFVQNLNEADMDAGDEDLEEQMEMEDEDEPFEGEPAEGGLEDLGPADDMEALDDLDDMEDLPDEEEGAGEGVVRGEVNVLELVDSIADAITDQTGVRVVAQRGEGEGEEMPPEEMPPEEMPPEEMPPEGMMPPEEEEEAMMAENYIRRKVRAALMQEHRAKKGHSERNQKVDDLYKSRMQNIAKTIYKQSQSDVIKEDKMNAFSTEVQRRVLSRMLKEKKK
jgi:hypothetical protein